jgi:type II secretory pathway pseudopilin PulG
MPIETDFRGMLRVRRHRRQAGFSYIEVLVGILVLGLVAAGLAQGLAQSSLLLGRSKADSIAHKVAAAELDQAHRIDYDDLGTVAGNPPGIIPSSTTKTVSNQKFKIDTTVSYVDDQALGQPKNYVNYKKVVVTVTPLAGTTKAVTQSTLIAPPSIGAIAGKATAIVTVVDSRFTDIELAGVSVTIDQSTSAPRTGVTDANGQVIFAGLEPSAIPPLDPKYKYRLTSAYPGYVTHSSTLPADMQQHLAAKQTWNATIKMFKPTTIKVNLYDKSKRPAAVKIIEAALTTIETDAPVQVESQFDVDGAFTFTQLSARPIEPGNYTIKVQPDCYKAVTLPPADMPLGYPATTTHTVDIDLEPLPHAYLDVRVMDPGPTSSAADDFVIPGASVQVSGGPSGLSPINRFTGAGAAHYCLPPSVPTSKYIVSGIADGYVSQNVLVEATGAPQTLTLFLVPVPNSCGISLNAGVANKWVRLVGSTYTVSPDTKQTSSLSGVQFGKAYFPNLMAGTYTAYIERGFSSTGAVTWSPGVVVTCTAGIQNKVIPIS